MSLKQKSGFTIVELLIVIVVIGILAAITLVAYNGISKRATIASMRSDLANAAKQLNLTKAVANTFPANAAAANDNQGLKASQNTTYQYTVDNTVTPPTFCLTATNGTLSYYVTQDGGEAREGACPGHTVGGGTPPNTFTTATLTPRTVAAGSHSWSSVAMSADGTKLLIGDSISTGLLYTSNDSGATWTPRTSAYGGKFWSAVAMSADGTRMIATVNNGSVWYSTDSGASWTENTLPGARTWNALAMSADGLQVGMTSSGPTTGTLWTSENGGVDWTQQSTAEFYPFTDIDFSSDGSVRIASRTNSYTMYRSINGGAWADVNPFAGGPWRRIACSATCTTWLTGVTSGRIYYTLASGGSRQQSSFSITTTGAAVSDDGLKMFITPQSGRIWTSVDAGTTWAQIGLTAQTNSWTDISASNDGSKFVGVGANLVYTGIWE